MLPTVGSYLASLHPDDRADVWSWLVSLPAGLIRGLHILDVHQASVAQVIDERWWAVAEHPDRSVWLVRYEPVVATARQSSDKDR